MEFYHTKFIYKLYPITVGGKASSFRKEARKAPL